MAQGVGIESRLRGFQGWLKGWPDGALTLTLLLAAAILVYIALRGTAVEKAVAAAWVYFP